MRVLQDRPRRSTQPARGVAAVELGLVMIPLVLMIFGTSELGRAIYTYNTLDKTVRDAARHLSQHGPGDATIAGEARCLAVYGNTTCSGNPLAPGLSTSQVSICDALACAGTHANVSTGLGSVNLVTVGINNYAFNSIVTYVVPNLTFNAISATLRAQL